LPWLCLLFWVGMPFPVAANEPPIAPAALEQAMLGLMDKWQVHGTAVSLIEAGEVVLEQGYGWADTEASLPALPTTVFQVASISKAVSAAVALRLVQEGLLDLDVPISGYLTRWQLPESEFDSDEVTLRRVLSHTAGLSVPGYMGFPPDQPAQSLEASLISAADAGGQPLTVMLPPGKQWAYSGGGFTLMQLVIEEVTGRPFADVARTKILAPLGMDLSSFGDHPRLRGHKARAYTAQGQAVLEHHFTALAAAGLWATAGDIARFASGLMRVLEDSAGTQERAQRFLGKPLVQDMFSVQPNADSGLVFAGSRWGLGMGLLQLSGQEGLLGFHPGDNPPAWHALLALLPEQQKGFAVLTNGEHGEALAMDAFCLWIKAVRLEKPAACPAD